MEGNDHQNGGREREVRPTLLKTYIKLKTPNLEGA